jgi:hypothetical protein
VTLPPKLIVRWVCPCCHMDLSGKSYSLDEGRKKCTKTWHKAVPVKQVYVSEAALKSPELRAQVADALMSRYRDDEFGCRRRPADGRGEGAITGNPAIAACAADRALDEALRVVQPGAELSPC